MLPFTLIKLPLCSALTTSLIIACAVTALPVANINQTAKKARTSEKGTLGILVISVTINSEKNTDQEKTESLPALSENLPRKIAAIKEAIPPTRYIIGVRSFEKPLLNSM